MSPFRWHKAGGDRWQVDPPGDYLGKVVVSDTDHLWGVGGTSDWVWRTVTRGHNLLYMDTWGYTELEIRGPEPDEGARLAMGRAVALTGDLDFTRATPRGDLASTGFVLADPGRAMLVYNPYPGRSVVDLTGMSGDVMVTWIHPERADEDVYGPPIKGGAITQMVPPGPGHWLIHLEAAEPSPAKAT